MGGKTTKSGSCANATEEVNKKLNNTNPKSFFMDKHRRFQDRDCGTIAMMTSNMRIESGKIHPAYKPPTLSTQILLREQNLLRVARN